MSISKAKRFCAAPSPFERSDKRPEYDIVIRIAADPGKKIALSAAFHRHKCVKDRNRPTVREKDFDLLTVLQGCQKGNRNSQRRLYEHFYGYAMSISQRYSKGREEAVEILNDGFLKAFNNLDKFDSGLPFKPWLRRILVNTAIDYHRKNRNLTQTLDLASAAELASEELPLPKLSNDEDVLPILQKLSPAYRVVFNLYIMEGYSHQEIAELLGIDARTSRSNLVRATQNLRALMTKKNFDAAKLN